MSGPQVVQAESVAEKPMAPAGWTYIMKDGKLVLVQDVNMPKMVTAALILEASSGEEFLDTFYPLQTKNVEVGNRVWNRSTKRFGHVVRAMADDTFRVKTGDQIGTYWESELEVR